jgi:hypothetical protein
MENNCYEMLNCNLFTLFNKPNHECISLINKQLEECKDHPNYDKLTSQYIYKYEKNIINLKK